MKIDRGTLIQSLKNVQSAICGYIGNKQGHFCDCKYGIHTIPYADLRNRMDERNGCPEVRVAIGLLQALTPDEFEALLKRVQS